MILMKKVDIMLLFFMTQVEIYPNQLFKSNFRCNFLLQKDVRENKSFCSENNYMLWPQSLTSLETDLRQDINRGFFIYNVP